MLNKKIIKPFRVLANHEVKPNYFMMTLEAAEIAKISNPGNFVMLNPDIDSTDPLLNIPLAIYKTNNNSIDVLYHVIGSGTRHLTRFIKNDYVVTLGPLGNSFNLSLIETDKKMKAIVVAGGIGIAPLFSIIQKLRNLNHEVDVYLGVKSKEHFFYETEISELGDNFYVASMDGSVGYHGLVTNLLLDNLQTMNLDHNVIYASGPNSMLVTVAAIAEKFNIPAEVSMEAYMSCGIGACHCCSIKTKSGYKLCCVDGPIFDVHQVI